MVGGIIMEVTYRPMTPIEAWNYIVWAHKNFHSHLKKFGYGFQNFIPENPRMTEMFEQEKLTLAQLAEYESVFKKHIYQERGLRRYDSLLKYAAVPALQDVVNVMRPFAKTWSADFPNKVEIQTTYGQGGSYNYENPGIIYRMTRHPAERMVHLLQHEFIHILIELPIIKKYNVPQDLKERIVDIIGFEYFGKPVQPPFENSFANKYITIGAIENDLAGAVEKMMTDYNASRMIAGVGREGM